MRGEANKRGILRQTGMHWKTPEEILQFSEPPGYRMRRERMKPKPGPFLGRIADIFEADREVPGKQRRTARGYMSVSRRRGTRADIRW